MCKSHTEGRKYGEKETVSVFGMTIIMTIMEMTGLPAGLFVNIKAADINSIYFILMINL